MRFGGRGFAVLLASLLAAVTGIPYWLSWVLPFPGSRFNGNLVFDHDFNTYFAFMRQASAGQWLFHNPFTPEPHGNVFFNLEFLAVGKLAALLSAPPEACLQIARIGGIFLLCLALDRLCALLFAAVWMRRFALAMTLLGGGFGWALYVFPELRPSFPRAMFLDLYAGLHPFFWMMLHPHALLAQGLEVWAWVLFLRGEQTGSARWYLWSGLLGAAIGASRPYEMVHLSAAVALYFLLYRDRPARLLVPLCSLPVAAYHYWLFHRHPVFRWWSAQSHLPPAPLDHLVLSLGLTALLFLPALAIVKDIRGRPAPVVFVMCCAAAAVGLFYSYPLVPYSLQFAASLPIPLLLAGLAWMEPRIRRRAWSHAWIVMLVVHSMTSWHLLASHIEAAREGQPRTDIRRIEAFRWLHDHSQPRDVVLALCSVGNQIPRYTHNVVYCGNAFNTVRIKERDRLSARFFDPAAPDSLRRSLIEKHRVRFVLALGEQHFAGAPFLREVFRSEAAVIYRVLV